MGINGKWIKEKYGWWGCPYCEDSIFSNVSPGYTGYDFCPACGKRLIGQDDKGGEK